MEVKNYKTSTNPKPQNRIRFHCIISTNINQIQTKQLHLFQFNIRTSLQFMSHPKASKSISPPPFLCFSYKFPIVLQQFCMVMKINVDCNACCRKLRRIILKMKAIEKHLIEKDSHRLIVFGRFRPSDIAIKIRRKMNRRVEILDYEEMEPEPIADQNPPPPVEQAQVVPGTITGHNPNPMFPSLEHDDWRPPVFPSLAAHQYRSFSSSRPDFAVAYLPEPEMEDRFWHYGHDYEVVGDRDHTFSCHDYYHY